VMPEESGARSQSLQPLGLLLHNLSFSGQVRRGGRGIFPQNPFHGRPIQRTDRGGPMRIVACIL
jgi:hypothetical protein